MAWQTFDGSSGHWLPLARKSVTVIHSMTNPFGAPDSPAMTSTAIFEDADVEHAIAGLSNWHGVGVAVGVGVGVGVAEQCIAQQRSPLLYWASWFTYPCTLPSGINPLPTGGMTKFPISTSTSVTVCAIQSKCAPFAIFSFAAISSCATAISPLLPIDSSMMNCSSPRS